jgi:hypothetical protein
MEATQNEVEVFEPVVGELYEFANGLLSVAEWTRPLYYVGKVPPPCQNGQFKYLAYDDSNHYTKSIQWFEFIRKPEPISPIPYESVLEKIRSGDIIFISLFGEFLRLVVSRSGSELYGKLVNGAWGIDITEAYKQFDYKDFKITQVNETEVLPPNE